MTCPQCHAPTADSSRFCSSCGAALQAVPRDAPSTEDLTRTSDPTARQLVTPAARSPGGGWLSSSGSISHGRFQPGVMLDNRYRIVGLIGRGGMGEVYRADDLRLGQPVALKLLPEKLARDPSRLAEFHNEVRTARQVSHPNVCRVYDIGEADGLLYLSMELVDGEDLAALLRRIGRLPEDKALDIGRQMCAGLAAAHDRNVLHRDLKPANIMLDGAGKVRIMDFGLATAGETTAVRAGTPAYMAPEQIARREVTRRSDIYALGLVLYELFTGRRVFDAKTMPELTSQHAAPIAAPSEIIATLDRRIERAILMCLEDRAERRPASALAVAAALPGDPLADALAAGETPSPELVAAAGSLDTTMSALEGTAWMIALVLLMFGVSWLADRTTVVGQARVTKSAEVLADYAARIRDAAGYGQLRQQEASGFDYDRGALGWYADHGGPAEGWARLAHGTLPVVRFWNRTSDRGLDPYHLLGPITREDPPPIDPGDVVIELDDDGRLLRLAAVPRTIAVNASPAAPVDWSALMMAADVEMQTLTPTTPTRPPSSYADTIAAWEGRVPRWSDAPIRVEAASVAGRPVSFEVMGPWTGARQPAGAQDRLTYLVGVASLLIQAGLVLIVLRYAWLNLHAGRSDRKAAVRVALAGFTIEALVWVLLPAHSKDPAREMTRFFSGLAWALLYGVTLGAAYLGLEPYVRRSWPRVLVGWTRLLRGRWRDPLVGHDILVGLALGFVAASAVYSYQALSPIVGQPAPPGILVPLGPLNGLAAALSTQAGQINLSLVNGLFLAFVVAALKRLVRPLWILLPLVALAFALTYEPTGTIEPAHARLIAFGALPVLVGAAILLRYGLLAWIAAALSGNLTSGIVFTLDPSRAYFHSSLISAVLIFVLALVGLRLARGDDPLFGKPTVP